VSALRFHAATLADADTVLTVLTVLNEPAGWLAARGIAGWQAGQWKGVKLAAASAAHGRGIRHELLALSERMAREHGKRYLRLDCPCASAGLRAYYAAAGFGWRGDREVRGTTDTWCGALFEKRL
jgi:GNAT superfamily N-acetyltransferase